MFSGRQTPSFPRSLSVLGFCLLLITPSIRGHNDDAVTAYVAEATVRKLAHKVVMPTYPPVAVKRKQQGRVVVKVLIDEKGILSTIKPVEAPDASFLEAVTRAVRQWKFGAATLSDGRPAKIDGKLTFYFRFQNGSPVVMNPGEK